MAPAPRRPASAGPGRTGHGDHAPAHAGGDKFACRILGYGEQRWWAGGHVSLRRGDRSGRTCCRLRKQAAHLFDQPVRETIAFERVEILKNRFLPG